MQRYRLFLLGVVAVLVTLAISQAQDTPVSTPEVGEPTAAPIDSGPIPTDSGPSALTEGEATATPSISPAAAALAAEQSNTLRVLLTTRLDLETLATSLSGGARPEGWSGSSDFNTTQGALLLRLDLEIFTATQFGAPPVGWFGAVGSTPYAIARDIRHDLELLADNIVGVNMRPTGWVGDDPLLRCARSTQTLVNLLQRGGVFTLTVPADAANFCQQAEIQASVFAESNLLSNAAAASVALSGRAPSAAGGGALEPSNQFAIGFLDRNAARRAGLIPLGTTFSAVARSYATFSRMMLVEGDGFLVFVEYDFTTISAEAYEALPNVDDATYGPFCEADWCDR
jgi:hypothetical protein